MTPREHALDAFNLHFDSRPEVVAFAPGRVNLIGEHTDYNDGFVFPAAIDQGIVIAASRSKAPSQLHSAALGEAQFDTQQLDPNAISGWAKYPAGVSWSLSQAGFSTVSNLNAVVVSTLPIESGLSSSAALEVAFATVWNRLDKLQIEPVQVAKICQRAENEFVGVSCGIMDQLASACGRAGHGMFTDIRSLEIRYAAIPENIRIVVCDTGVKRSLQESQFNERFAQCQAAATALGVASLRDASLDDLLQHESKLDADLIRIARHVITENTRSQGFYWALEDRNLLRIGLLMRASHESLREDYRVTIPELDAMAEACWAAPGCIGARMTGAGFGGSVVALVDNSRIDAFTRSVSGSFAAKYEIEPQIRVCVPSEGARILPS